MPPDKKFFNASIPVVAVKAERGEALATTGSHVRRLHSRRPVACPTLPGDPGPLSRAIAGMKGSVGLSSAAGDALVPDLMPFCLTGALDLSGLFRWLVF